MQTILSEEDFRGDIDVAGTEQPAIAEELQRFIQQYEPAFIEAILGYDLSKAFYDGAAVTTPDQRWIDLMNGVVWDNAGKNVNWQGLKACGARYVYYYYMKKCCRTAKAGDGIVPQASGATVSEVVLMCIDAWNTMSRRLCTLWDYVSQVKDGSGDLLYPEWANGRGIEFWKFRPINQFDL